MMRPTSVAMVVAICLVRMVAVVVAKAAAAHGQGKKKLVHNATELATMKSQCYGRTNKDRTVIALCEQVGLRD